MRVLTFTSLQIMAKGSGILSPVSRMPKEHGISRADSYLGNGHLRLEAACISVARADLPSPRVNLHNTIYC